MLFILFYRARSIGSLPRGLLATCCQDTGSQFTFAAHYMQHVNRFTFPSIEDAARWLNYLTVAAAAQLARYGAAIRMNNQLVDVPEDPLDQFTSGCGFVERNVIGDGV